MALLGRSRGPPQHHGRARATKVAEDQAKLAKRMAVSGYVQRSNAEVALGNITYYNTTRTRILLCLKVPMHFTLRGLGLLSVFFKLYPCGLNAH